MKPTQNSQSSLFAGLVIPSPVINCKYRPSFWFKIGVAIGISSSAIAGGWLWQKLDSSLPQSVSEVSTYARPGTLTIKASDGSVLQEIGNVSHEKIDLDEVPEILPQAFIASEDRRFYQHDGVDFLGITRAAFANLLARNVVEGGSTITQQLSRIVYLDQNKNIWRKVKEMKLASQIEATFDKQEILTSYLNLVYFGSGCYGVADAAWTYFGKSPEELSLPEVATLAGIVPAPSIYSPLTNPELAKSRRNLVLNKMKQQGFISAETARMAIASPLVTQPQQPKRLQRFAPYFTDYIQQQLPQYVSPEVLQGGGIVVETTLNPQWQQAAETTIEDSLDKYGKWQKFQQGALISLDPQTGAIKAMVGGQDFEHNQFNRVTQAQRQPGSTFKTFVYTAAIAAGFSPYKTYLDAKYVVDGYQPKNYKDKYRNKEISLYDALVDSINIVALRTLIDVGWNPTIEIAQKMGIQSELTPTYSLALGAWEVNLFELTNAYATLANQGIYQPAYGIHRIRDRHGKIIYQADFPPQEAIDSDTAATMTWMLQGVVNNGTGIPAQIGRPAAGKTGTSDQSRDLWYIGYIPQLATGIWLGNDNNQPTAGSSSVAAEMWRKFMLEVVKDLPVENFPSRPDLTTKESAIEAEAVKPKQSYYLPLPKSSSPTSTSSNSQDNYRDSASTPADSSPPLKKPLKFKNIPNYPFTENGRDWVKERLGR